MLRRMLLKAPIPAPATRAPSSPFTAAAGMGSSATAARRAFQTPVVIVGPDGESQMRPIHTWRLDTHGVPVRVGHYSGDYHAVSAHERDIDPRRNQCLPPDGHIPPIGDDEFAEPSAAGESPFRHEHMQPYV